MLISLPKVPVLEGSSFPHPLLPYRARPFHLDTGRILLEDFRPLGYEPSRVLASPFCSITEALVVSWFVVSFGQFCGGNGVDRPSEGPVPRLTHTKWPKGGEHFSQIRPAR